MKPKVDKDLCIGCMTCSIVCGSVFRLVKQADGQEKAEPFEGVDYEKYKQEIEDAIASCPTAAISKEE